MEEWGKGARERGREPVVGNLPSEELRAGRQNLQKEPRQGGKKGHAVRREVMNPAGSVGKKKENLRGRGETPAPWERTEEPLMENSSRDQQPQLMIVKDGNLYGRREKGVNGL